MRSPVIIALPFILMAGVLAQQPATEVLPTAVPPAAGFCSDSADHVLPPCKLPRKVREQAQKDFNDGIALRDKHKLNEAFVYFKRATEISPRDYNYLTAREVTRQQIVYADIERGNKALADNNRIVAMASFRAALELDPSNEFARQRLRDSLPELPRIATNSEDNLAPPIVLQPAAGTHSIHFRGNTADLLRQLAQTYGLTAIIDDSVVSRRQRVDLGDATWDEAISSISRLTRTMWTPLSAKQVLFAADTVANRRDFQHTALRTFYVPNAPTPQTLNDLTSALRILFDIRYVTLNGRAGTITIRAPQETVEAATEFMRQLSSDQPQVMLDIKVFEVAGTFAKQLGLNYQSQMTLFNVPTEAQSLLGNQSIQQVINQLIASGAINQASSSAIAAIVAQALGGQSSLLTQPFATFGKGTTLMGLTIPVGMLNLGVNSSMVKTIDHITLRATSNTPAVLKIGERYPVVNASFAPIYNTPAIANVIKNQSYLAPFPSFNFEDLGINMKSTAQVYPTGYVTLNINFQLRGLGAQAANGVPIITNREYTGQISARDGQTVVLAGLVTTSEQNSMRGLPLLGKLPVLGKAFSSENKQQNQSELLIVMTPHILSEVGKTTPAMIRIPTYSTSPR